MTSDDFERAARAALLEREVTRVSYGLARQVEEAVSFRDAVGRAITWLLDDAETRGAPRVPAARAGGSDSLLTRTPDAGSIDPFKAWTEVLEEAFLLRSPGGDAQAATRVAELILRRSRSWLIEPQTQVRRVFVAQTIELAVATATSRPAFLTFAPKA